MIRNFKLFAICVESMRTAEREYQKDPTPFNKNIMEGLQNKCDGWLAWIKQQEDSGLVRDVPPFIGRTPSSGYRGGAMSSDVLKRLMETHTPEEIERYTRLMEGKL